MRRTCHARHKRRLFIREFMDKALYRYRLCVVTEMHILQIVHTLSVLKKAAKLARDALLLHTGGSRINMGGGVA